jgi:pimeloyl-ACP methyl ester carboxylesterase/DNA-binding CsgD family transcriptional regulator
MTDPIEPDQNITPNTKGDLIESIYRIALEPQTYDSFMGQWDDFILGQISKLNTLQADTSDLDAALSETEITNHFAIAMQLLEQAGRPDGPSKTETLRSSLPQMVFNETGILVWHNNTARNIFGIGYGTTLESLKLSDEHRTQVLELLSGESAIRTVLARIAPADGNKHIPVAFQISNASPNERLFMATQVRQSWPENTSNLLNSGFGLSKSEVDICEYLVEGQSIAQIAETRQSAVETVRTQMKKILQKTDCSGQVELVNLLHGTMRLAEQEIRDHSSVARIPDTVMNIRLNDRLMPVETFGDPNGTPVIFFHGMLDGNTMIDSLRRLLHERGFQFISPVRPSFGTASPDHRETVATAPARLARDIEALLETTGTHRPIFLGHMAGAVYAHAAAAHLGDRVRGVLSVSGAVPITAASQFASMSVRQRIVALTARYTPGILPFVIRAGISQIDNNGERQFLHSLYQHSPSDMRTISDLEIRDIILSGYQSTIAQGHRAFEIDSYHVVRDWTSILTNSHYQIELLHGVEDPVVSIASVRDFAHRYSNRIALTSIEDTGQLALYAQPNAVISALERLRDL